jgi:Flp pilus assembly protein TadG
MPKLIRNAKRKIKRMERGQVLIMVTFAMIGIIAVIGLALDVGLLFLTNARLRRAVDAAALSAAQQVRAGFTIGDLNLAAEEFINLNGLDGATATVEICDWNNPDPTLCTIPERKLVRVKATAYAHLAFLPVIPGMPNAILVSATAVSETASMDVVLVIDTSESMTYGTDLTNPLDVTDPKRDPQYCNTTSDGTHIGSCEPFNHVIDAANGFVDKLYFPYDRVSIITFDKNPTVVLNLADNCPSPPCQASDIKNLIHDKLDHLKVYAGDTTSSNTGIYPSGNPSRCYGPACDEAPNYMPLSNYQGLQCPLMDPDLIGTNSPDPSQCTTTNIGGGLYNAARQFGIGTRQEALWVVILLTDGTANAGSGYDVSGTLQYYCPTGLRDTNQIGVHPLCNDGTNKGLYDAGGHYINRHSLAANLPNYDAADFAYDMADYVGLPYPAGQGALIYAIGLGPLVNNYPMSNPVPPPATIGLGKLFLKYASTDITSGLYYDAPSPAQLTEIFRKIAENIATRLSK